MRVKEVHVINGFEAVMNMLKITLRPKLFERVRLLPFLLSLQRVTMHYF